MLYDIGCGGELQCGEELGQLSEDIDKFLEMAMMGESWRR